MTAAPAPSREASPRDARPRGPDALERELKFALRATRAPHVLTWLRACCRPDPHYPAGAVESLYFDTRALEFLYEKVNSDFRKTKVRLRWYPGTPGAGSDPAFVELKERIGPRRRKLRVAAGESGARLLALPLHASELRALPGRLRRAGVALREGLLPTLVLRYRRWRFVEPASGARVNLDAAIRVTRTNPALLPAPLRRPWSHAVLEVKGSASELPARLAGLRGLGLRKSSLSKYAAGCIGAGGSA